MNTRSRTLPPPQYNSPTPREKSSLPSPAQQRIDALQEQEQLSPLTEKPTLNPTSNGANNPPQHDTTQLLHSFIDNNPPYDQDQSHVQEEQEKQHCPISFLHSDTPEITPEATPEPDLQAEDSLDSGVEDEEEEEDQEEDVVMRQPLQESSSETDDDGMDESKSEGELEAIQYDMQELADNIPGLTDSYKLIGRLGEG